MNDTVHLSHLAYGLQQLSAATGDAEPLPNSRTAQPASPSIAEHFKERKLRVSHQSLHEREQHDRQDGLDDAGLFCAGTDRQQQLRQADLLEEARFLENFRQEPGAADQAQGDALAGWSRYAANLALVGGYVAQRAGETRARRELNKGRDAVRGKSSRAVAEMLLRVPAKQGAAHA